MSAGERRLEGSRFKSYLNHLALFLAAARMAPNSLNRRLPRTAQRVVRFFVREWNA